MYYETSPKKQFMLRLGSACCDEIVRGVNIVWCIVLAYTIASLAVMAIGTVIDLAFKVGA